MRAESGSTARTLWIAAPMRARSLVSSALTRFTQASASRSVKRSWPSSGCLPMPPCR